MSMTNALPAGPRGIRRLQVPDAPWNGVLAHTAEGARCMLVEPGELGDDVVWRHSRSGHLAVAEDLVRTPEGHLVQLPVCTQRLGAFTARRRAGEIPLSPGEAITLAVSLLRGTAELVAADASTARGQWWLAEDGRPVLVGGGEQSAADAAAELIADVRADLSGAVGVGLDHAAEVLADPRRLQREAVVVEAELFTAAEAEPLATSVFAPVRARQAAIADGAATDAGTQRARPWDALLARVDGTVPEIASNLVTALWRRLRVDRPRPQRRTRPVIAALAVAAVVLGVGILWPQAGEEPATAQPRHPSPSATVKASPTPTAQATAAPLAQVAVRLLDRRAACADARCRAATQEDADAVFTGDVSAEGKRHVTLLDDFGGAAVLRVDTVGQPERLAVMVLKNGEWLLRDITEVAEQPEG
ncbi:hypothetical protein ET475_15940 [Microbacterium protaetiae]|uniref:Uncharacterized protein n=1 Tax=Microbacterium protaetiae TaxID=2509458 RepID=A0A4V0YDN4_9MICO|nr:hypothetical protein [Microbacterium protaetiae]QAY61321.1 hypothetical protein ET475_15940 [Microbacterium protaetiae]